MISVVVPAFNASGTLGTALETLMAQTYPDWEAVVVDDGSRDSTAAVIAAFQVRDRRVRSQAHPGGENRGTAASRNLGVREAHGGAVAFLDADDELLPEALASYVEVLERHPSVGVIYGQAESFGDGPLRVVGRGQPGGPWGMLRQLARFNVVITSATAARREALGGEPFPVGLSYQFEDWACWLELSRHWPFFFLPRVLSRYRVHGEGFTARMERAGESPLYEVAQALQLRRALGDGSGHERDALHRGLVFRGATALLKGFAAARHGRWSQARPWLSAGLAITSPALLPRAIARCVVERRRISRRVDPPLTLTPPPSPAQGAVQVR